MKKFYAALLIGFVLFTQDLSAAEPEVQTTTDSSGDRSEPTWEFVGASRAAVNFGKSDAANARTSKEAAVSIGAGYFFSPQWELSSAVDINTTWPNGYFDYSLLVGPTFNFCGDPSNAFYLGAKVGIGSISSYFTTQYEYFHPLMFTFSAGKRFEIVKHVTWAPQLTYYRQNAVTKTFPSGSVVTLNGYRSWNISLFRFAVLF